MGRDDEEDTAGLPAEHGDGMPGHASVANPRLAGPSSSDGTAAASVIVVHSSPSPSTTASVIVVHSSPTPLYGRFHHSRSQLSDPLYDRFHHSR